MAILDSFFSKKHVVVIMMVAGWCYKALPDLGLALFPAGANPFMLFSHILALKSVWATLCLSRCGNSAADFCHKSPKYTRNNALKMPNAVLLRSLKDPTHGFAGINFE